MPIKLNKRGGARELLNYYSGVLHNNNTTDDTKS